MMRRGLLALILLLSSMAFLVSGCSSSDDDNKNWGPITTPIDETNPSTFAGHYEITSFTQTTETPSVEGGESEITEISTNDPMTIQYHKGVMDIKTSIVNNATILNIKVNLQLESYVMMLADAVRHIPNEFPPITLDGQVLADKIKINPEDNKSLIFTDKVPQEDGSTTETIVVVKKLSDTPEDTQNKPFWTYTEPKGLDNMTSAVTLLGRYVVTAVDLVKSDKSEIPIELNSGEPDENPDGEPAGDDTAPFFGEFAVSLTGITSFNPSVKFQFNDSELNGVPGAEEFMGKGLIQSEFPTPIVMQGKDFIKDLFTKIGGEWVGTEETDLTVVRTCVELGTSCDGGSIKFYLQKVSDNMISVKDGRLYEPLPTVTAIDMAKPETLNGRYTIKSFHTLTEIGLGPEMPPIRLETSTDNPVTIQYHKGVMDIATTTAGGVTALDIKSKIQLESNLMISMGADRYQFTDYPEMTSEEAFASILKVDPADNTALILTTSSDVEDMDTLVTLVVKKISDTPEDTKNKPYWTYTEPQGLDDPLEALTLLGRYSVKAVDLINASGTVANLGEFDSTAFFGEFAVTLARGAVSLHPSVKFQLNDEELAGNEGAAAFKGKGLIQVAFPTPIVMEGPNFIADLFTKIGGEWIGTEETDLTVVRTCVELGTSCDGGSIKFYLQKVSDNMLPVNDGRPYYN